MSRGRWSRWGGALAFATIVAVSAPVWAGSNNPYSGPLGPANPPAPPGSALDPEESAEAASPTSPESYPSASTPTGRALAAGEKRAVPRYSADPPSGSPLLWVPRMLLSPLYLTSEFLIRRPLGAGASYAEAHDWPARLVEFFTWNDRHSGLAPVASVDFGIRPNAGFYFFWDDLFVKNNDLRVMASSGGPDWVRAQLTERWKFAAAQRLEWRAYVSRRPDHSFWGLGPESGPEPARFGATDLESRLRYRWSPWTNSRLDAAVRLRRVHFDSDPDADGGPSLAEAVAAGRLELPPGLPGYTIAAESVSAVLDSRPSRVERPPREASDFDALPGSGIRLTLGAEYSSELASAAQTDNQARQWLTYGGSLGGYVDLTGQQRTLGLSLNTQLADPLGSAEPIPFTELPSLGGNELLRGFRPLRLVGRSAVAGELSYRWPIWASLDGNIDVGAGNVFGEHLAGFDWGRLRLSADLGIRTLGSLDYPFEVLFGFGTQTFERGARLDEFRFVVGTTSEF